MKRVKQRSVKDHDSKAHKKHVDLEQRVKTTFEGFQELVGSEFAKFQNKVNEVLGILFKNEREIASMVYTNSVRIAVLMKFLNAKHGLTDELFEEMVSAEIAERNRITAEQQALEKAAAEQKMVEDTAKRLLEEKAAKNELGVKKTEKAGIVDEFLGVEERIFGGDYTGDNCDGESGGEGVPDDMVDGSDTVNHGYVCCDDCDDNDGDGDLGRPVSSPDYGCLECAGESYDKDHDQVASSDTSVEGEADVASPETRDPAEAGEVGADEEAPGVSDL